MQPVLKITAGRVPWLLGTLERWAQPLAGEEAPALAVAPAYKLTVIGRWIPPSGKKSAQTPLELAEGWSCCTHSLEDRGSSQVRVKGHVPDDTCEHVSHHLQLLFRSSSQGQQFGLHVRPVSVPTSIHKFTL